MRKLTVLLGALTGAAMLTACDDNRQLTTAPGGRSASSAGRVAAEDLTGLKTKGDAQIVTATGDITAGVGQFRDLLGGGPPNPNVAGDLKGGRREINWDGVPAGPAGFTNNDLFPGNFFNVTSPRGVLFSTDGSGFRISNNGYVDVNANYAGEFNTFSPTKLFAPRGSTITDVQFVVAGSNDPATVTGFGSVFEDVGRAHSTTIEYFDVAGNRLLTVVAPRRSDENGLSFAGAVFKSPVVARVRITSGDTPIGPDDSVKGAGQKRDIVVMDDFIYGEPRKIN